MKFSSKNNYHILFLLLFLWMFLSYFGFRDYRLLVVEVKKIYDLLDLGEIKIHHYLRYTDMIPQIPAWILIQYPRLELSFGFIRDITLLCYLALPLVSSLFVIWYSFHRKIYHGLFICCAMYSTYLSMYMNVLNYVTMAMVFFWPLICLNQEKNRIKRNYLASYLMIFGVAFSYELSLLFLLPLSLLSYKRFRKDKNKYLAIEMAIYLFCIFRLFYFFFFQINISGEMSVFSFQIAYPFNLLVLGIVLGGFYEIVIKYFFPDFQKKFYFSIFTLILILNSVYLFYFLNKDIPFRVHDYYYNKFSPIIIVTYLTLLFLLDEYFSWRRESTAEMNNGKLWNSLPIPLLLISIITFSVFEFHIHQRWKKYMNMLFEKMSIGKCVGLSKKEYRRYGASGAHRLGITYLSSLLEDQWLKDGIVFANLNEQENPCEIKKIEGIDFFGFEHVIIHGNTPVQSKSSLLIPLKWKGHNIRYRNN